MNLAFRDVRHKFGRFVLTCLGLSLLLGVVVTMAGIFRGQAADALALSQAIQADIWVVQGDTNGPFAEGSRIPGDTREMVARMGGVTAAGSLTLQTIQVNHGSRRLRVQVVGFEPGRPGEPANLFAGRDIHRSHFEVIADRQAGLALGERLTMGRNVYTVVGLTQGNVTLSGDSVLYMTLLDAQQLQFDITPAEGRREVSRGASRVNTNIVNAVVARVSAGFDVQEVADAVRRWKHLSVLTDAQQSEVLTRTVIERASRQLGLFMAVLTLVSAVIIALIVYTLTMEKLKEIATLKLIGAPDRTIIGLIVQQALMMGVVGFGVGTTLVALARDRFPRRVVMDPGDLVGLFFIVICVCILASAVGVRVAVRVDPAKALVG